MYVSRFAIIQILLTAVLVWSRHKRRRRPRKRKPRVGIAGGGKNRSDSQLSANPLTLYSAYLGNRTILTPPKDSLVHHPSFIHSSSSAGMLPQVDEIRRRPRDSVSYGPSTSYQPPLPKPPINEEENMYEVPDDV